MFNRHPQPTNEILCRIVDLRSDAHHDCMFYSVWMSELDTVAEFLRLLRARHPLEMAMVDLAQIEVLAPDIAEPLKYDFKVCRVDTTLERHLCVRIPAAESDPGSQQRSNTRECINELFNEVVECIREYYYLPGIPRGSETLNDILQAKDGREGEEWGFRRTSGHPSTQSGNDESFPQDETSRIPSLNDLFNDEVWIKFELINISVTYGCTNEVSSTTVESLKNNIRIARNSLRGSQDYSVRTAEYTT